MDVQQSAGEFSSLQEHAPAESASPLLPPHAPSASRDVPYPSYIVFALSRTGSPKSSNNAMTCRLPLPPPYFHNKSLIIQVFVVSDFLKSLLAPTSTHTLDGVSLFDRRPIFRMLIVAALVQYRKRRRGSRKIR